jgi:hypothetical protein
MSDQDISGMTQHNFRRSDSIAALGAAMAKAQAEIKMPEKDKTNTFFNNSKYADLAAHLKVILPPFSSNGLTLMQFPRACAAGVDIETLLVHSSGEWISDILTVPVAKKDAQGLGSAITYGRRYALSAIAGTAGDDDDGNAAVRHDLVGKKQQAAPPAKANVQSNNALTMPWVVILDKMRADGKLTAESLFAEWGKVPKNLGDEERKQLWRLWKSVGEANGFPWSNDLKCFAGANGHAESTAATTQAGHETETKTEVFAEPTPDPEPATATKTSNDPDMIAVKAWCGALDARLAEGSLNSVTIAKVWEEVPNDLDAATRKKIWEVFLDTAKREGYPWNAKKKAFVLATQTA